MTQFPRSIADFVALPGWRALRWFPVLAAFATMAAPPSADAATRRRAAGAYDGSGTWSSRPRVATVVPATAFPSPSRAAAFHRPAAAGSRARSIAPGRLRSEFRLGLPRRTVVAVSPAGAARAPGAASSPATVAAAPGRRREADRGCRSLQPGWSEAQSGATASADRPFPDCAALHPGYGNENGPPDRI